MATIPDEQLDALVKAGQLLQTLQSNPHALAHLEAAVKVVNPNVETSAEVAARQARPLIEPLEQQLQAVQQKLDQRIAADDERESNRQSALAEASMSQSFRRLQDNDGYTTDGIEKIKQLMVDRNIADPDAAAALFDRMNPPAKQEQAAWEPQHWNLQDNAVEGDVKSLFADPDKWADNTVGQVLLEERRRSAQE
jgi:hypothetical protein